ncbi:hypothetical protein [Flavobacterium sp. KBS0721]|uniref:hypothetical protein n=1 Tax=Flavobacterium sp. KBS0721 TaxID=1179672 RepID=UPI00098F8994|nr:hypothetical protein [Flavobacterium sp. KBS0721]QDW19431.1 hypothetical protein B0M43_0004685 [Flavobacterium sp. KBS0721]
MIKRYSIFLLLFLILSCKSKEEKMFFDFDNVEYYSLYKNEEKEIIENNRKGIKDSILNNILYSELPDKLDDNVFYKTINSNGFSKFELSQKDIEYLKNDVFLEKFSLNVFQLNKACAPEYRDILVFKKNNEISGIAKICFSCGQFYIISSKREIQVENFGTEEEYKSLEKLFKKYKKE